jgi:hypothetical protein
LEEAMSRLSFPQILLVVLALALLATGLSFGSYYFSTETLTSRRGGQLSFIPRDYRLMLVEYRLLVGAVTGGVAILFGAAWLTAEMVARLWQQARNRELAANAVLLRIAPRVDEKSKWETAADMWAAIHSTLARPGWQVWLGAGLHLSLEMVQQAGERLTFYLWAPRPVAETLTWQLRATYAGLEIETLVKSGPDGAPANAIDDYLDQVASEAEWRWADLGLAQQSWRPLRLKFAGDPLSSLLSALEGLAPGNQLAAIHFVLRPAADGWQNGGQAYIARLRGDNAKPGKPKSKLGSQERDLIKQIEQKAGARGYHLCLRLLVAGQGDVAGNLERLIRVFDQFGADNTLTIRANGSQAELSRVKGRFLPAGWRKSVVSDLELAAMAHLPNQEISGLALMRARARLEKPSPVSFVDPDEKRLVIGRFADVPAFSGIMETIEYPLASLRRLLRLSTNGNGAGSEPMNTLEPERSVGIKLLDTRRHFHVIGPTGVGKSTMLLRMIWQYLDQFPEAAVWLQEPHQDLTHKVIKRVPLWREKDIIWLDVMDPERVIGLNPLDVPAGTDVGAVVADVLGVTRLPSCVPGTLRPCYFATLWSTLDYLPLPVL